MRHAQCAICYYPCTIRYISDKMLTALTARFCRQSLTIDVPFAIVYRMLSHL